MLLIKTNNLFMQPFSISNTFNGTFTQIINRTNTKPTTKKMIEKPVFQYTFHECKILFIKIHFPSIEVYVTIQCKKIYNYLTC